jgi:hypothetical protein
MYRSGIDRPDGEKIIFELPSNLFLDKFGARKWIARIMISWASSPA